MRMAMMLSTQQVSFFSARVAECEVERRSARELQPQKKVIKFSKKKNKIQMQTIHLPSRDFGRTSVWSL